VMRTAVFACERTVRAASGFFGWLAAGAVVAMMLLTGADVILRFLRRPVPGTYELVGFLGALAASLALAQTSVERGHIAVDVLVQRLSRRWQVAVDSLTAAVAAVLFGLVARESARHAAGLRAAGEVSMTLQMPVYPVVYGVAAGCALLALVQACRLLTNLLPASPRS